MKFFAKSKKFLSVGLIALSAFSLFGIKKANAMWPSNNQWQNSPQSLFGALDFYNTPNNQINNVTQNFQPQQNITNISISYNKSKSTNTSKTTNKSKSTNASKTTNKSKQCKTVVSTRRTLVSKTTKDLSEKEKIEITRKFQAARKNGDNLTETAQILGVSQSTLREWENKYSNATIYYPTEEKQKHVKRCRAMMKKGYTIQSYADENGLIASTLSSWLQQY